MAADQQRGGQRPQQGRQQASGGQGGREQRREGERPASGQTRALVRSSSGGAGLPAPSSLDELSRWARMMAESGYFKDSRSIASAAVKIAAGAEYGFGPVASMSGIHIIEGNPTLHARLQAAIVRRSGIYDYRIKKLTDEVCILTFFEIVHGEKIEIGESAFDLEDANRAQLLKPNSNWDKYPRNMLFARALTNGIGWFCPDVFGGVPTYTPEELGRDDLFDVEGRIVSAEELAVEPVALPEEPVEGEWREVDEAEGAKGSETAHGGPQQASGGAWAGTSSPTDRAWRNPGEVAQAAAQELGFSTTDVVRILGKQIRFYADDLPGAWARLVAAWRAEHATDDDVPEDGDEGAGDDGSEPEGEAGRDEQGAPEADGADDGATGTEGDEGAGDA